MYDLVNTSKFGGNNGRQGIFDRNNPDEYQEAVRRLQQLQSDYGDKLSLNYTGSTGLLPNDLGGYSTMQNAKTEAQNIQNIMGGRQPLSFEFGGEFSSPPVGKPTFGPGQQSAASPMPYANHPAMQGLQAAAPGFVNPHGSHEEFMQNNPAARRARGGL